MTTSEDRFQTGQEMRSKLGGGDGRTFEGSVPSAYQLAPDMYRIVTECLYGSIWGRPGLDIRYRAIATLTAATVRYSGPQVRAYTRNALNVGLTPEEIVEILMQTAFYGGIPAAYNALDIAKEIFEERGVQFTPPQVFDTVIEPDALYEIGVAKHGELMPDVFGYYSVEPTREEHENGLVDARVPLGGRLDTARVGHEEPYRLCPGSPGCSGAIRPVYPPDYRRRFTQWHRQV